MPKQQVVLAQVNNLYGKSAFLPYSVGIIQAYAQNIPHLNDTYDFTEFVYLREPIEEVVKRTRGVQVFGASLYIWNHTYSLALVKAIKEANPNCLIVLGGPHVPNRSDGFFLKHPYADVLVHNEGEATFAEILERRATDRNYCNVDGVSVRMQLDVTYKAPERARLKNIDALPSPYLTGVFDHFDFGKYEYHPTQEIDRGCPFSCLAGDTPVNTVYGDIPIKEIVERGYKEIGVFTYDCDERKVKVTTAKNIKRTGRNKKLLRVHFDDNTHIDCTSDHRFLVFKWGNQFVGEREWEKEASALKKGDRVRAVKWYWSGQKRDQATVCWGRRGRACVYRIIAEWMLGRELMVGEAENLEVVASAQAHMDKHPEVAQRMRENNPTKNGVSAEWRANLSKSLRGFKRSEESKERYRQAALKREAAKSAEQKSVQAKKGADTKREKGIPMGNPHKDKKTGQFATGNHKIVRIEELPGLHDVYCMEVPETSWFYANNVLVHNCHFCDWGSSVYQKVRRFGDERLYKEIQWFADKKLDLVYNASANYGIVQKDVDVTKWLVESKNKTGYPKKFRAAYAKNSGDRVFTINKMLNDAGMSKGATLSFQSMDPHTLDVIKRKNIGTEVFRDLMKRYRAESIPTYSELIIGLPGETYNSFANGLDELVDCGQHDSLSIYCCEVLPNAELNEPAYRELHKIKSTIVPVLFFHGTPSEDEHQEHYELVTSTATLSRADWFKCMRLAWAFQGFHCLPLLQCIAVFCKHYSGISYREFYEKLLDYADANPQTLLGEVTTEITDLFIGIQAGRGWGIIDLRFGNIIWPPEEGTFLKCVAEVDRFYKEVKPFLCEVINNTQLDSDLVSYQFDLLVKPFVKMKGYLFGYCCSRWECRWDIPKVLNEAYQGNKIEIKTTGAPQYYYKCEREYPDLETYAREAVWYNRKGGRLLHKVEKVN